MSDSQDNELIKWIRSGKQMTTAFDRRLENESMTLTQWEVILCLLEQEPMRQKDIAHRIGVDPGAIVKLVDRLERDRWIKRKTNTEDQRSYLVYLTEYGRKQAPKIIKIIKETTDDFTAGVSKSDREAALEYLEQILKNLREIES